jgi:hypothetical protein
MLKRDASAYNVPGILLSPSQLRSSDVDPAVSQQPIAHDVGPFERAAPRDEVFGVFDHVVDPLDERTIQVIALS